MSKRLFAALAAILMLAAAMALFAGCKSPEQIEAENVSPATAPDITLNVPLAGENVISVSGSGIVIAQPDMAEVTFSIRTEDEDAAAAQTKNTELMEAVLTALRENGVEDADIQTGYIQLYEMYNYDKTPPLVTGYEMFNEIIVTVRDLDKLGSLMSSAIAAGATNAGGVNFMLSDTAKEYSDALKAAVADAYNKALALAEASGCTIEETPVSMTEISASATPVEYREYAAAEPEAMQSADLDVSVSSGEMDVEARVNVEYRIVKP